MLTELNTKHSWAVQGPTADEDEPEFVVVFSLFHHISEDWCANQLFESDLSKNMEMQCSRYKGEQTHMPNKRDEGERIICSGY